ncbi:OLC1v1023282C1 [Oldenlandia corymbosa var. corymbosa]|uniref:folate gamma-glutamyl hydrolase n=1 Tax=Oldenlandia corymbosa var. corymbosa TaxID=529605 RepID=A0AAV1C2F1_OLDCO|nr:OLC1v1023282C1 [Oldenlandia corymbosa var. corymbosa]
MVHHFNYLLLIPLMVAAAAAAGDEFMNENSQLFPSAATTAIHLPSDPVPPSCPALNPNLNYRPVIGILSHPGDGASGRLSNDTNASYIAASYVKFVESAGARVIPLIYNEPPQLLEKKLNLVNGVLFTGGWAKTGLYFSTVQTVFKKVLEKNDAGDHFPVIAICLGFELLTMIISQNQSILEQFSAADQAATLQFIANTNLNGTVFQRFPPDLLQKLSTDCIVMQNHHVYVSTVMGQHYPVTGFQWHPGKNAFEWGLSTIPHSEDAVRVTQHVANFFVSEARKSSNRPPAREVLDNLIYNYTPTYGGKAGRGYDEVYIFT